MALKSTVRFRSGLSVSDSHMKITRVAGNKDGMTIRVDSWVNKQAHDTGQPALEPSRSFVFAPNVEEGSANFIRQGYLHLKGLPEFAGAIDT